MFGILGSLGTAIVSGVSDYFKGRQEIKKVELEADKMLIMAEAQAKAEDVKRCCELADELKKVMDTFKRSC